MIGVHIGAEGGYGKSGAIRVTNTVVIILVVTVRVRLGLGLVPVHKTLYSYTPLSYVEPSYTCSGAVLYMQLSYTCSGAVLYMQLSYTCSNSCIPCRAGDMLVATQSDSNHSCIGVFRVGGSLWQLCHVGGE